MWNRKYYRRNKVAYRKNCRDEIVSLANHRKRYNDEGEILVIWHGGERHWSFLSLVHHDCKEMVEKYLLDNNLTKEQMCMKKFVAKGSVKKKKKAKKGDNKAKGIIAENVVPDGK